MSSEPSAVRFDEIKRRWEALMLTQEEAAVRAGWADFHDLPARRRGLRRWSDMENGRYPDPRISTMVEVSRVLGCRVDDLVG